EVSTLSPGRRCDYCTHPLRQTEGGSRFPPGGESEIRDGARELRDGAAIRRWRRINPLTRRVTIHQSRVTSVQKGIEPRRYPPRMERSDRCELHAPHAGWAPWSSAALPIRPLKQSVFTGTKSG